MTSEPPRQDDEPPAEGASGELPAEEASGQAAEAAGVASPPASVPAAAPVESGAPAPRRVLTRSADDRWLGGVAGGFAEYLGIDSVLLRIAIVIAAVLSAGLVILLYLVAWIIMPPGVPSGERPGRRTVAAGSAAGIVFGAVLIAVGALWLLNELDVEVPRGGVLLAVALIGVGALTVATAGRRGSGGLIALGVVLSLILASVSAVDLRVNGAFGDRTERPASFAALDDEYSHAFGSLTVDLTRVDFPRGTEKVKISIAFGDLRVIVPDSVGVRVNASTFFGSADVFGREISGVAVDNTVPRDFEGSSRRLDIELSTAFGSAEVDAR